MIDSLHSLAKSPLPAITALNLRANRLRSIAGVERSLSLERLDLRDNLIPDPTEIARLTAIPYIREIWVSGNPFTRSHYGYRLTMFNLFRQTPGFSEDILIDAYGPGYSEKKQLVVRVAEPEAAPVVRRPEPEEPSDPETPVPTPMPLQTRKLAATSSAPLSSIVSGDPQKPLPPTPTRHVSTGGSSSRRKKTHRRRVIDLTQEAQVSVPEPADEALTRPVINHALTDPFLDTVETTRHPRNEPAISGPSSRTTHDAVHRPTATKKQSLSENANSRSLFPAIESVDWEVGGDLYRQRLEALKQELGPNWLKVLGDDTWDGGKRDMGVHPAVSEYGPPILPRSNSQVIVTGGRTLG
jgi:Leucine-rich repeat (LRR) protein